MAKSYTPVFHYPTEKTGFFHGQKQNGKVLKDIKEVEHSAYEGWWPTFFPTAVGFLVTGSKDAYNVMTVACISVVNAFPFMLGFPLHTGGDSPRGDGPRYSVELLEQNRQFTVNMPNMSKEMTTRVVICGSFSGRDGIDKFEKAGFHASSSLHVEPPIIRECPLNFECRVHTIVPLTSHQWVIGQVDAVYLNEEVADGRQQFLWRSMPELIEAGQK